VMFWWWRGFWRACFAGWLPCEMTGAIVIYVSELELCIAHYHFIKVHSLEF